MEQTFTAIETGITLAKAYIKRRSNDSDRWLGKYPGTMKRV